MALIIQEKPSFRMSPLETLYSSIFNKNESAVEYNSTAVNFSYTTFFF